MKLKHCLLPFIVMLVIAGSTSTCDKKQKPQPEAPTWVGTYDSSGCRFVDAGNVANLDQKLVMECLPTDDVAGAGGMCE